MKKGKKLANYKRSLTDDQLDIARSMYMEFTPLTHIAKEMGVPRTTLSYYVQSEWKETRNARGKELLKNMSDSRYSDLAEVYTYSVKALKRCIRDVATRKEMITTKEANDIVKILDVLERLTKEGKNPLEELEEEMLEVSYEELDIFSSPEKGKKDDK